MLKNLPQQPDKRATSKTGWSFEQGDSPNHASASEPRMERFNPRILTPLGREDINYARVVVAPDRKPLLVAAMKFVKHLGNVPTEPTRFSWSILGELNPIDHAKLKVQQDSTGRLAIKLSGDLPEISAVHVMAKYGRFLLDSASKDSNGAWRLNLPYKKIWQRANPSTN
jgi:hypothetical protein